MNSSERKISRAKNKVAGVVKQVAGKITGDEVLELKGRMQSSQADFQQKTDVQDAVDKIKHSAEKGQASIAHKVNDVQQSVAKRINDTLDEHAHKKSK